MSEVIKLWVLVGGAVLIAVVMFVAVPPVAQPLAYHDFSDMRGLWGIPNFSDVVSNAAFVPAGLYGVWVVMGTTDRAAAWSGDARLPLMVFFFSMVLIAPGSAYYHWAPDNGTLFWDRLPMTVAFMGFSAAVIVDRIHVRPTVVVLVLITIGVASAVYWHVVDDLRAYILVQFLPMLMIPLVLWMYPQGRYITWRSVVWVFVFYALAKWVEHFDAEILELLGGTVSGHTLKHVFAAMAPVGVAVTIQSQGLGSSLDSSS